MKREDLLKMLENILDPEIKSEIKNNIENNGKNTFEASGSSYGLMCNLAGIIKSLHDADNKVFSKENIIKIINIVYKEEE